MSEASKRTESESEKRLQQSRERQINYRRIVTIQDTFKQSGDPDEIMAFYALRDLESLPDDQIHGKIKEILAELDNDRDGAIKRMAADMRARNESFFRRAEQMLGVKLGARCP